ncbi:MAG: hypothetical protein HY234_11185 [Acidobacteria bacterium]|nr:hypothetical protein [Acidobacteriota bacterium]
MNRPTVILPAPLALSETEGSVAEGSEAMEDKVVILSKAKDLSAGPPWRRHALSWKAFLRLMQRGIGFPIFHFLFSIFAFLL